MQRRADKMPRQGKVTATKSDNLNSISRTYHGKDGKERTDIWQLPSDHGTHGHTEEKKTKNKKHKTNILRPGKKKNLKKAGQWWHTPLAPELGRQRQAGFWVRGQPGLNRETLSQKIKIKLKFKVTLRYTENSFGFINHRWLGDYKHKGRCKLPILAQPKHRVWEQWFSRPSPCFIYICSFSYNSAVKYATISTHTAAQLSVTLVPHRHTLRQITNAHHSLWI